MAQNHELLGAHLIAAGLITPAQLDRALLVQGLKPYFRLGEVLVYLRILTIVQLDEALAKQYKELLLGQLLIRKGYVTQLQLDAALAEQQRGWRLLGTILVDLGFCSEEQVKETLAEQHQFAPLEPDPALFEPEENEPR